MGGDSVEQVRFGLCLIKAIVALFIASLVVLLCWRFLRSIPGNRGRQRPPKHPMVHPLGTVKPTRIPADADPGDRKRRIG